MIKDVIRNMKKSTKINNIPTVLAVIPARGGSKTIRKKNIRLLNGKPLIFYSMKTALESKFIQDVIVTSDDAEILSYASRFPVHLRMRPLNLAMDEVPLDPVVYDAMEFMEKELCKKYDVVMTLQPTSPLLKCQTLDAAIDTLLKEDTYDTVIPLVDATHLYWKETNGRVIPDYYERLNRQWLPKRYKETGAFLITRREFIKKNNRFGKNISVYFLSELEGLDIDSPLDWVVAESLIKQIRIVFVVNGNKTIGMGHIQRTLALANRLLGHELFFVTFDSNEQTCELLLNSGFRLVQANRKSIVNEIQKIRPHVVINDILDTTKAYITRLKRAGYFIVNFEDLGDGSEEANLTFNALYEKTEPNPSQRFGYKYECINEKFLLHPPICFKTQAETLLLTFGGIDQNNLTCKIMELLPKLMRRTPILNVVSVIGSGYSNLTTLQNLVKQLNLKVEVHQNVDNMPKLMAHADIAITSNGRTVYELASMGIPTLSIAQNDRETLHSFARYHKGVKYLGIANNFDQSKLLQEIIKISTNNKLRKTMYQAQVRDGGKIRKGTSKVINEIILEYWRYDDERNKDWH